jgi:hypothetical protein
MSAYMPRPPHPLWLDHTNNNWWRVNVMKLLIMETFPASGHFLAYGSTYSPEHQVLKLSIYVLNLVWQTKFHTLRKQQVKLKLLRTLITNRKKTIRTKMLTCSRINYSRYWRSSHTAVRAYICYVLCRKHSAAVFLVPASSLGNVILYQRDRYVNARCGPT